jgi:hypothetical protein
MKKRIDLTSTKTLPSKASIVFEASSKPVVFFSFPIQAARNCKKRFQLITKRLLRYEICQIMNGMIGNMKWKAELLRLKSLPSKTIGLPYEE